jgi:hypothetical protein
MAAPRNDRPAGRAPSDGPVGSDTGVYHLFAWPRFAHLDRPLKRFMEASETLNPQQPCISVSLVSGSISCAVLLAAGSGAFDDLHPFWSRITDCCARRCGLHYRPEYSHRWWPHSIVLSLDS